MSWWTNFRDTVEGVATGGLAGFWNDSLAKKEGAIWDKITGRPSADERAANAKAVSDQIQAYKDQTDFAKQQLDQTRAETESEKRRVQEKQIRSLRRNYRSSSAGMLGSGQPAAQDMNTQLGG